jgi:signal transduction histidine kinase
VKEITLERDRTTALFRIFQEALTNVARHSGAREVNVNICQDNGELILQIQDNGRGISEAEASGMESLGLLGMKERALMIGGEILVTGQKNKGTLVKVKLPLDTLSHNL